MGLDMYLNKRTYLGAKYDHNKITGTIDVYKDGKRLNINLRNISEIEEEVGYWIKANQIHRWFVEKVQNGTDDCGEYCVTIDELKSLKAHCEKVLNDRSLAPYTLPTQEGFFFGGTDYDEYYFEELQDTVNIIDKVLEDEDVINGHADIYYTSSW